ncbi:DSBA-like thioredoxin domain-containing protein [Podospora appendiculata]|uniref:DSBA-like thioredoxin domain-containing protein n=1 Tax=Podospora appendiculata TaxID=314037 RepID=A0AAE1CDH5_9PEZI|nr:DSBA-like thioredoxin domain-containing protein [Podospora appendiculata]
MTNFNVKVVSDAICPWCYIGKKRLETAIRTYKKVVPGGENDTFTVTWHPFYLDPTLANVGVDRKVHLAKKFPNPQRLEMVFARLQSLGEAEGIDFSNGGKIGNTRDAHRLVQLAKTKGNETENKVIAELFKSHFEEGGDITSQDMLVTAAAKAGLDKAEAKSWLETGKGGDEVDLEVEQAYAKGISGVPNFTINGRYELGGAQEPETFLAEFMRAKKSSPDVSTNSSDGVSC